MTNPIKPPTRAEKVYMAMAFEKAAQFWRVKGDVETEKAALKLAARWFNWSRQS